MIQEKTQPDRVLWRLPMVSLIPENPLPEAAVHSVHKVGNSLHK